MKNFSKKLVISSLSTLMSVGLVAGITGTIAWYQYSTRATTTIIGTSVSNTGVLQISKDHVNWTRDLITADIIGEREGGSQITPVTFGKMNDDGSLPTNAYKRPDASENPYGGLPGSYSQVYQVADAEHDYIQYTVYLRALVNDNVTGGQQKVKLPVFLSDIMLDDIGGGSISKGLRVHLAIDENADDTYDNYYLLSKEKVENLALFGALDLDGDEKADIVGGYETVENRDDVVIYGNEGEHQDTLGIDDIKASRNANGDYDLWDHETRNKVLFYTPGTEDDYSYVKVTVTFWFEGWDTAVDTLEIDSREVIYREKNDVFAQDVDGYYVLDAGNYVLASGKAVDGTSYYDVYYREIKLAANEAIPANTFTEDAGVYTPVATPAVAVSGTTYYERKVVNVTSEIHFAELVAGLYTKSGNDYLLITNADEKAVAGNKYYEKLSQDQAYEAVVLEDALHNPLPAGSVDVSEYYTLNSGNYLHATGTNESGVTYYRLVDAGKIEVPIWSGENTDGVGFRFGLTFDVGKNAFNN